MHRVFPHRRQLDSARTQTNWGCMVHGPQFCGFVKQRGIATGEERDLDATWSDQLLEVACTQAAQWQRPEKQIRVNKMGIKFFRFALFLFSLWCLSNLLKLQPFWRALPSCGWCYEFWLAERGVPSSEG